MTKSGKIQVSDICERYGMTRKQYYELRRRFPKIVDDSKRIIKMEFISAGKMAV